MAVKDIQDSALGVVAIPPQVITDNTPLVSATIKADFFALEFFTSIGVIADAAATFTVFLEDATQADMSDAEVVPAQFLSGTLVGAGFAFGDNGESKQIGYVGKKQYVRYVVVPADVTTTASFSVLAVKAISGTVPHS